MLDPGYWTIPAEAVCFLTHTTTTGSVVFMLIHAALAISYCGRFLIMLSTHRILILKDNMTN
jgi:hypothetical protein